MCTSRGRCTHRRVCWLVSLADGADKIVGLGGLDKAIGLLCTADSAMTLHVAVLIYTKIVFCCSWRCNIGQVYMLSTC